MVQLREYKEQSLTCPYPPVHSISFEIETDEFTIRKLQWLSGA